MIDEQHIRRLLPHAGGMCLLNAVLEWSATHIVCHASSHRVAANPLAIAGRLSALHLVEYGAQAMAIHGSLNAGTADPEPGLLVSIRDVQLHVDELSVVTAPLVISAHRLQLSPAGSSYEFKACADDVVLGRGRVLVMVANR